MKIIVLAGGKSTEREVSLWSGRMIYEELKQRGHQTVLLDVSQNIPAAEGKDIMEFFRECADCIQETAEEEQEGYFGKGVISLCQKADMVFLALHGEDGENGKVQAAFDLYGISYTGTDYVSAALAMDKRRTKELLKQHRILVPDYRRISRESSQEAFAYPKVVKVQHGGSSIGVYIVRDRKEYRLAKEAAFQLEDELLVEEYIKGREFSVGVIEGKALPVIEIKPKEGFYDFRNKYQQGCTEEICPAVLSSAVTQRMQKTAEQVVEILGILVYARIDFILSDSGKLYCLEANALPGMTITSLLPQEAAAAGLDFGELCEKIIEVSFKKYGNTPHHVLV